MDLTMSYIITQHISKATRIRESDEPSRVHLILTSDPNEIKTVNHSSPLWKSYHRVLDFEVEMGITSEENKSYRLKRYNYSKTNFNGLRTFFLKCRQEQNA